MTGRTCACGATPRVVLDGELWCDACGTYLPRPGDAPRSAARPTPGPWDVTPDGTAVYSENVERHCPSICILAVASHVPPVERAANGRLIAAAPGLAAERDTAREERNRALEAAAEYQQEAAALRATIEAIQREVTPAHGAGLGLGTVVRVAALCRGALGEDTVEVTPAGIAALGGRS